MKTGFSGILALAFFLIAVALPAFAEEQLATEIHSKFEHSYSTYTINGDGTVESAFDWSTTVMQEDALKYLNRASITYSTSAEKADITEAYTLKADGRKIMVPKDNYQLEVDSGKDKNAPAFSDETTMTVIFPDLAVGDTTHLSYKVTQTKPIFPGKFSLMQHFSKYFTYDDARVSVSMPLSLHADYESFGLTEKSVKEENDRKIIEWTYQNKQPLKSKYGARHITNLEKEPGFLISNFPSYQSIAEAYGASAKPKAAVTNQIRKLADDIAKGKTTPHDQAKAIYEWVSQNINYAGNCIGVGAVVPRDLDFVIGNKLGDCKDHATLLQALLAAKGIDSMQALVDASSIYHLPKIPVVSIVNHVINYIPSLNLFLDSTTHMPFGLISPQLEGKPVLLVDGFKNGMTIPIPKYVIHNRTEMKAAIAEDGMITGTTHVELHGAMAAAAYEGIKKIHKDQEKDILDKMVQKYGLEGTLELERGEFDDTDFSYSYTFKFKVNKFLKVGSPGAFYVYPLFTTSALALSIAGSHAAEVTDEFPCSSDYAEEDFTYDLPKNITILAVPDNVTASNNFQTYKSTYQQNGHSLHVTRLLDDVTPGPTCLPDVNKAYKEIADKAMPDLKAQVVYK